MNNMKIVNPISRQKLDQVNREMKQHFDAIIKTSETHGVYLPDLMMSLSAGAFNYMNQKENQKTEGPVISQAEIDKEKLKTIMEEASKSIDECENCPGQEETEGCVCSTDSQISSE
jgi:recombinational DNA repair protein RecR